MRCWCVGRFAHSARKPQPKKACAASTADPAGLPAKQVGSETTFLCWSVVDVCGSIGFAFEMRQSTPKKPAESRSGHGHAIHARARDAGPVAEVRVAKALLSLISYQQWLADRPESCCSGSDGAASHGSHPRRYGCWQTPVDAAAASAMQQQPVVSRSRMCCILHCCILQAVRQFASRRVCLKCRGQALCSARGQLAMPKLATSTYDICSSGALAPLQGVPEAESHRSQSTR